MLSISNFPALKSFSCLQYAHVYEDIFSIINSVILDDKHQDLKSIFFRDPSKIPCTLARGLHKGETKTRWGGDGVLLIQKFN